MAAEVWKSPEYFIGEYRICENNHSLDFYLVPTLAEVILYTNFENSKKSLKVQILWEGQENEKTRPTFKFFFA